MAVSNITEHPVRKIPLWAGLILALILVGILLLVLPLRSVSRDESIRTALETAATSFADRGSYNGEQVRSSLESLSPNDPNYVRAHIIYSLSQFATGTREDRLAAVRLVKDRYAYAVEHQLAAAQAYALNELVRYAVTAYDRKVTEEIFKGDFATLYDQNNIPSSLARLSKKGIDVYPTSDGYLAYASSVANDLTLGYVGVIKLEETERVALTATVHDAITQADVLFERDNTSEAYQFFGTHYPVMYYFTRGKLFGTLALFDSAQLRRMDESFDTAVNASQGSGAQRLVDGVLPYLYLTRALVTLAVAPEREDVVRASAAAVANIVQSDPEGTRYFVQYLSGISRTKNLGELLTIESATALAKLDLGFKNILISAGWKLGA